MFLHRLSLISWETYRDDVANANKTENAEILMHALTVDHCRQFEDISRFVSLTSFHLLINIRLCISNLQKLKKNVAFFHTELKRC